MLNTVLTRKTGIGMLRRRLALSLLGAIGFAQQEVFAGLWFSPSNGADGIDRWDDLNGWYTWHSFSEKAKTYAETVDVNLIRPGTILVESSVWSAGYYYVKAGSENDKPVIIRIVEGGYLRAGEGRMLLGAKCHDGKGGGPAVLDIRPGGTNMASLVVGDVGPAVVTNAGTIFFNPKLDIGQGAGSMGLYVHDGGRNKLDYAADLRVGINGTGELLVRSGTFNWVWFAENGRRIGFVDVGSGSDGTGTGRIMVEDGATMQTGPLSLGGRDVAGRGEVCLRGGSVKNLATFDQNGKVEQLWIGAATNAEGIVRTDSYGCLSGWGKVYANDLEVRIGNGKIMADGEGVERVLDCSDWASVSNVLASTDATGGWYAVNKGAVLFPVVNAVIDANGGGDNWGCSAGTNSVGCARRLKTPDLVNAVHVTANRDWQKAGWNFGVMFLADDRSDAYAAELPSQYRPLGFWKAGTFGNRSDLKDVRPFKRAEVRFRYDASKIRKTDSSLAVLRWDEAAQSWRRLRRYSVLPEDGVVSSGELTQISGDSEWTLGLFCVAELERQGMVFYVR